MRFRFRQTGIQSPAVILTDRDLVVRALAGLYCLSPAPGNCPSPVNTGPHES
ncbi:hypothetical protein [Streptomyces sp. NPDC056883]|uniref:hypothetical protein n=1 Tax=Streptomyces sp. NPDC056883 TaxID=3345959 RepID=UPI0036847E9D